VSTTALFFKLLNFFTVRFYKFFLSNVLLLLLLGACEEEESADPIIPDQPWSYTGLGGLSVQKVEVSGDWVYAATQNGMFRQSVDNSDTTWMSAGLEGLNITDFAIPTKDRLVASAVLDQDNPSNTLYVSNDGGDNWLPLTDDFGGNLGAVTCQALDYNPDNSSVLYGRGNYNVAKSTDGGETWSSVFGMWDAIGYQADLIQVYDSNPDIVWAGGETSIFSPYMVKSTDGGQNWQSVEVPAQGDNAVYSMVFDPDDPERVLAGMEGQLIYSEDGGQNWEIVLQPENYSYFLDLKVSLQNRNTVYAAGTDGGTGQGNIIIYISDDFGQNWRDVAFSGQEGKDYAARDLGLFMQSGQETIYVATNDGVFLFSP